MRDLLRLGYAVQQGSLIANLTGVAMDAVAIGHTAKRLGQLSVADCTKLRRLAESWLDMPDPAIAALAAEKEAAAASLPEMPQRTAVVALLAARYDAMIRVLGASPWQRVTPTFEMGRSPDEQMAEALWEPMKPAMHQLLDTWSYMIARVQLLGVHAAIRGHLWEYGKVPDTLDELQLGRLAIDPITGDSLKYRAMGRETYELSSEGPYERDGDGNRLGSRKPVSLDGGRR